MIQSHNKLAGAGLNSNGARRKKMSVSQVTYPIVAALVKAEGRLGENRCWVPKSPEQEAFLREVFHEVRDEVSQGIRGLQSSYSLAGNELTISGVLDLLVKWVERGTTTPIRRDGQEWEGVRLSEKRAGVRFLVSDIHPHPIVVLPTQSDDTLYLTMLDEVPQETQLRALATSLLGQKNWRTDEYGGVRFPMVDLRHDNDVEWLVGIETITTISEQEVRTWLIRASQETKLRMNEVGAHIRSEFRGTVLIGASISREKPDYIINRPFLLVFTRPGLKQPLTALHITEEEWKNPGTLDFD